MKKYKHEMIVNEEGNLILICHKSKDWNGIPIHLNFGKDFEDFDKEPKSKFEKAYKENCQWCSQKYRNYDDRLWES